VRTEAAKLVELLANIRPQRQVSLSSQIRHSSTSSLLMLFVCFLSSVRFQFTRSRFDPRRHHV
jgi:hypothetical protein